MKGFDFIPHNTKIPFVKGRFGTYLFSLSVIIVSLLMLSFKGINYGIDFQGGLLMEIRAPNAKIDDLRFRLSHLEIGDYKIQEFGEKDFLIRLEKHDENISLQEIKNKISTALQGSMESIRRAETVGPTVSQNLMKNGLYALFFAIIAMLIYIWFRFEWQFGLCAIMALVHDIVGMLGFYALTQMEFNETALIALLTVAGYSINDTVVVYDRIRENIKKFKNLDINIIIDRSINETLSRTILTSFTTLMALFCLYFLGGPVIAVIAMPLIVGIGLGTYSSIALASPMLLVLPLDLHRNDEPEHKA